MFLDVFRCFYNKKAKNYTLAFFAIISIFSLSRHNQSQYQSKGIPSITNFALPYFWAKSAIHKVHDWQEKSPGW